MRNVLLLITGWLFSLPVNALGLGEMTVHSDLGQPMNAEIKIVGANSNELPKLKIGIASPTIFKQNGVPYTHSLRFLNFTVENKGHGHPVIKVLSKDPVREPIVEFILDVSWSRGNLRRIYSVIIDPPDM